MSTSHHAIRFPGESGEYRTARDALLDAEIALRRQQEAVAALRRNLPLGGAIKEDYLFNELGPDLNAIEARKAGRVSDLLREGVFDESAPDVDAEDEEKTVRLSELFSDGKDSLIVYSFMYGPEMQQPCPACTSILDGLNGSVPHALQRVNVAVVAKSPIQRIQTFARQRGWHNLRLLSSAHNSYNADYHGETPDGKQIPALNVFVRRQGRIHHFYNAELLYAPSDPGQHARHADAIWPLWHLFDLTPDGRGSDWHPRLAYDQV
ncbi:DUF899 family protein [Paraherbaspirillum soli]|uniref:DUF899 family protein n=1 Tax=Paraherbaspirillum soli TaxID=631222 RepID=A0ABW0MEM0_9BURK